MLFGLSANRYGMVQHMRTNVPIENVCYDSLLDVEIDLLNLSDPDTMTLHPRALQIIIPIDADSLLAW